MNKGSVSLLVLVWFCFWLGHMSENWIRAALVFTLTYSLLGLLGDMTGKKKEKVNNP